VKETERREFKKSLAELKAGLISMVAILNKHGKGELWFGIRTDGKPVGLDAGEKTLRDVSQSIAAHVEPRNYPQVSQETVDGATCIKVAFEGGEKPYYALGRAYMRVADEDRQLSARELEKIIVDKNQARLRWDNQPCDLSVDQLDDAKLRAFVERAGLKWDTPENAFDKLELLRGGHLLNAAKLFFTTEPMELRCAVFGTTDSAMIIDRHDTKGDILEVIEEAQKYVLKNIHIGMRLEGLYRKDVPEIATEAMREAVINAFCHRDYRDPDYVQVAVYKDRVEIRNPGGLFGGITIADLRKGHISKRRNPLIADLFRRIEMVEAWGRGMPLILEHEPDVEFKEMAGIFIAAFGRPSFQDGFREEHAPVVKRRGEKVGETQINGSPKSSPKSSPKTAERIIALIAADNTISTERIGQQLGISKRAVLKQTRKLQDENRLKRVGPAKGGHWEVLK
jgi:ATP-dependent DNA helicase RecG